VSDTEADAIVVFSEGTVLWWRLLLEVLVDTKWRLLWFLMNFGCFISGSGILLSIIISGRFMFSPLR